MIWGSSRETVRALGQVPGVQRTHIYHTQPSAVRLEAARYFLLNAAARRQNPLRRVAGFVVLSEAGTTAHPGSVFGIYSPAARMGTYTPEVSTLLDETHALTERLALRSIFKHGMRTSAEMSIATSFSTLDAGRIAYVPERLDQLEVLHDDVEAYTGYDVQPEQKKFLAAEIGLAYRALYDYLRPMQRSDVDVRGDILKNAN